MVPLFLHHSLWEATTAVKSVAYKSLVRPILEYTCQVWSPHAAHDISTLENVQHYATRWACGSRWDPVTKKWNNPLVSVLICCVGLSLLLAITIYAYLHFMTFSVRKHPWIFQITIVSAIFLWDLMIWPLCHCNLRSTAIDSLFCEHWLFVEQCVFLSCYLSFALCLKFFVLVFCFCNWVICSALFCMF